MGMGKLEKFDAISAMPNVYQNYKWEKPQLIHLGEPINLKGKWHQDVFKNNNPITLELACGYGEYTKAISERYPNRNVIGVDIKGNRIFNGAKYCLENNLQNAAFLRCTIDLLPHFFTLGEVAELWITFPDPQRRKSKHRKRLSSPFFLDKYRQICKPGTPVHLKTDSDLLYEFTLETIAEQNLKIIHNYPNVYAADVPHQHMPLLGTKTRYEKLNLSGAAHIKYLQFLL